MIKLPDPDDQEWTAVERETILTAFREGRLVEAKPDERQEIFLKDSNIWFRGYCVGRVNDHGIGAPATVRDAFVDLLLGLDND